MTEFATNDEHSDSSSDFPDLDDIESRYSSTDDWSTSSDDEFVQDEEFKNRDR